MSRFRHRSASASSLRARNPPMLAIPSFLALMVQPSAQANISRAISMGARSPCPSSRVLMNQLFSANRQASRMNGMPCSRAMALAALMLARLTGWPPPELLVTVIMIIGMFSAPRSAMTARRASRSMFPLNGWRVRGSRPSAMTRSRASPPQCSMLARVVSKWVLLGMTCPRRTVEANRMCSAARPWWVGITCRKPVMSCTAASNR